MVDLVDGVKNIAEAAYDKAYMFINDKPPKKHQPEVVQNPNGVGIPLRGYIEQMYAKAQADKEAENQQNETCAKTKRKSTSKKEVA